MVLLMAFAFVAGIGTALSPCVLPVLPIALSAGATGEARLSRLARRGPRAPDDGRGGFGSGLLLGASLGLVYAPCAGPILAGVITVSASQDFTAGRLAVALSYSAGTAVVLYALMLGGRRLISPLARRSAAFQPAIGAVMVAVALVMAAELDIRFQEEIADNLPAALVNPSGELEETGFVGDRLADLRGGGGGAFATAAEQAPAGSSLSVLGRAPEISGTQSWFNTPGGRALSLEDLRGEVVLIDFWTYSCINCIRTLPYLKAWDERYRDRGLNIIGVHAPEF